MPRIRVELVIRWVAGVGLAGAISVTLATAQSVRGVPVPYATIGAALAAAQPGDTVLVAPGTYAENLRWPRRDGIRLVSEEGPQKTVIDGGARGVVVSISGILSLSTVLEGFTIQNGYLGGGDRAYGSGVKIEEFAGDCSPTIRGNVISNNVGEARFWSFGSGVYIDARNSNPLLERNVIANNVNRGTWAHGAGIYSRAGQATVVGNIVRDNMSDSTSWSYGAGILCGSGDVIVASNLITGNQCINGSWTQGAGLYLDFVSSAKVVNNTIVANTVGPSVFPRGGGVNVSSLASGVSIHNNIIASNVGGGGIHINSTTSLISLDYNVVWNNGGGNYSGVSPGANDRTIDPVFVSAGDYHLFETSPCIDSGSEFHREAAGLFIDYDGDPRPLSGYHGGTRDSLFRVDVGADEYAVSQLTQASPARLGTTLRIDVGGPGSFSYVAMLDMATGSAIAPPLGVSLLTPSAEVVGVGGVPGTVEIVLPNLPQLTGKPAYVQAITGGRRRQLLTNRVDVVLH